MKILVVHASLHGSTTQVAEEIGDVLREGQHDVVVWAARELPSPRSYDVVLAGSAIRAGRVSEDLERYFAAHGTELAGKPLALFAVAGSPQDDTEEGRTRAVEALLVLASGRNCLAQTAFAGVVDLRKRPWLLGLFARSARTESRPLASREEVRAWAADLARRLAE
jgi:menaquinone-dependent protoporphyrinogen IX oxidase